MVKQIFKNGQQFLSKQNSNIISAAVVITTFSFLSTILGLLKTRLLVGRFFEIPLDLDAYYVAFRIPDFVFKLLVTGAVSASFIPVFSHQLHNDKIKGEEMASSAINLVLLAFLIFSIITLIWAEPFTKLITPPNFTREQIILAAKLSRVMLMAQLLFAVSNFVTGILQANQRFILPAIAPVVYNLGIIIGIILFSPSLGIYGPAIGVVIGSFLHLAIQLPLLWKLGFKYSLKINLKSDGLIAMFKMVPPRVMAMSVDLFEDFSLNYFAIALGGGKLALLNLARQLMTAPVRIFSIPLGQASLPFLSKAYAENNMNDFKDTIINTLHQILFLAFPASALLLILRIPLVRLAYGSSNFPWQATLLTGKLVMIMSMALFAYGGIHILVRGFYAMQNTKIPFVIALISFGLHLLLSFLGVFVFKWNLISLSWAITIPTIFQFGVLYFSLSLKTGGFDRKLTFYSPLKMLLASLVMGMGLWGPMRLLDNYIFDTSRIVGLVCLTVVVSVIGGGLYLLTAYVLQIPQIEMFRQVLAKLGNWRKVWAQSEEVIESNTLEEY